MSDAIKDLVEIPQSFVKDGTQFFNKCTKPNKKEYLQICRAVGMGFVVMGFIGYFVKLIHIPLRQIVSVSLQQAQHHFEALSLMLYAFRLPFPASLCEL
ncbi:protein translocase SEC6 [Ceraceosorus guamensis]|uniref:Protein translocase SEC6 n=1 Tax=Ceraceosorus guamensis TaxID=1522189 RepID=A0A316W6B9_9BASI|nr:protein translocase SEC6 [Ceraceosorus guamensis]PWN45437.1 protein translocase SEC6 [Ceraceosorus guamensis]